METLISSGAMATYLIAAANRGIGYEYCHQLQARDTVIAVCRTVVLQLLVNG